MKLGVPFSDVVSMTAAQLHGVVFYPRKHDRDELRPPATLAPQPQIEPTLQRDLMFLASMQPFMKPGKYEAGVAQLTEFWRRKTEQEDATDG